MPSPSHPTIIALALSLLLSPQAKAVETQTCVPVELTFESAREYEDCFNDVIVDLEVTSPSGQRVRVPMFWAGKRVWKGAMRRQKKVLTDIKRSVQKHLTKDSIE